jgi:hypothetical protein
MHRRIGRFVLLAGLLLAPCLALGQTVTGRVVQGSTPLAGVAVQAELDGHALASVATGADGHFSLALSGGKTSSDLRLSFVKTGFRQENRLLSVGTAAARPLEIVLEPLTGSGAISDAERRLWDPNRTSSGNGPLLFVPYSLSGGAAEQATDINARLAFQLQRLIGTRLQAVLPDAEEARVELKAVAFTMVADPERLRTFGEYVNALGVVSGLGIGDHGAAGETYELSSLFVIIPRSGQFEPPELWINDAPIPAASIGRASLDAKLSKDWGRAAIVALATRDLKSAETLQASERAEALRKIRRYLIAERADVGRDEGQSAAVLQQLIALVDKAVSP